MATTDFPSDLVDLQKRVHAAWEAVETYRKEVDAGRRAQAAPGGLQDGPTRRWESPQLRPWTAEEDDTFAGLMATAREAALALRECVAAAGLAPSYDVAQGLHKAALS